MGFLVKGHYGKLDVGVMGCRDTVVLGKWDFGKWNFGKWDFGEEGFWESLIFGKLNFRRIGS